jgi:hypothetical protein
MKNKACILVTLVASLALLANLCLADQGKKTLAQKPSAAAARARDPGQQEQAQSASMVNVKGPKIQSQLVSSGATIGGTPSSFRLLGAGGLMVDGSAAQLAVGSGSSESFAIGSGFWQEEEEAGLRGDVTGDGIINVGDVVYLVSYLYKSGPAPDPVWIGDCNCDEIVNVGDIVFLVSYLYKGGPEPVC